MTDVDIAATVAALCAELLDAGVVRDDVVISRLGNSWQFLVLYLALQHLGAVIVPVPQSWRRTEIDQARQATRARWRVSQGRGGSDDDLLLDGPDGAVCPLVTLRSPAGGRAQWVEPESRDKAGRPVFIAFSVVESGTRWVEHTEISANHSLRQCSATWQLSEDTHVLVAGAVGFLAGFQWGFRLGMFLGAEMTVLRRWDAKAAADAIDRHGCDFFYGTIRQLDELLAALDHDDDRDLVFVLAASQPTPEIVTRAQSLGCTVIPTYGQPESFLMSSCARSDSLERRGSTRGSEVAGTSLSTAPRCSGADTWQDIETTGPHVGRYIDVPASSDLRSIEGSTLVTGDEGWIDDQGYLHWVGSRSNVIMRSGIAISPEEIAEIFRGHPDVLDAHAYAIPSPKHGEGLLVSLDIGRSIDEAELMAYMTDRGVARYKLPDQLQLRLTAEDKEVGHLS